MKLGPALRSLAVGLSSSTVAGKVTCLWQSDFDRGTYIIDKSGGTYELCENISFKPNAPSDGDPIPDNVFDPDLSTGEYSLNAFGLGFFAAIVIEANDVTLNLNGFTLEQSSEHALMQRFFALIDLASAPFIRFAGPANFVGDDEIFKSARNVIITGPGHLGRSSHHAIKGNGNKNIVIKGLTFSDFEVAAVALNNVDNLVIRDCEILRNRHDVPVVGLFSAARFIRPYVKVLADLDYEMPIRGKLTSASVIYDELMESIRNVYDDVIHGDGFISKGNHPLEYSLFDNPLRIPDAQAYGFLVHGSGPAVGDFGEVLDIDESKTSSNVVIRDNIISNITNWSSEIPAAAENGRPIHDPRGAIVQFVKAYGDPANLYTLAIDEMGHFNPNPVLNAQMIVASAILDGTLADSPELQTAPNSITRTLLDWVQSSDGVYEPNFICGGDCMHHVAKGTVVIRIEDTIGVSILGNIISGIVNLSFEPFQQCSFFHAGTSSENLGLQEMGDVRGIALAAVRGFKISGSKGDEGHSNSESTGDQNSFVPSTVKNNVIVGMTSANANIIVGIDVAGWSREVIISQNYVNLIDTVGDDPNDAFVALRLRSKVDKETVVEMKNILVQGVKREDQSPASVRRYFRSLFEANFTGSDTEWVFGGAPGFGGCPFVGTPKA